jgi:hypothetical protein
VTIKNTSGGVLTVQGQRLQTNEEYTLSPEEVTLWDTDDFGALIDGGDLEVVQNSHGRLWKKSDPTTTTTSTNWQQKMRLNLTIPEDAKYRVGYTADISNSNANQSSSCRVQLDDGTPNIDLQEYKGKDIASMAGFSYHLLTSGTHTVDIDYKALTGGTAKIQKARLEVWRASVLAEEV